MEILTFISNMAIFLSVFLLFTINLIAVSLSLQCNRNKNIFFKISASIFAFMFGLFYIIINFYYFKISKATGANQICNLCDYNIFPLI